MISLKIIDNKNFMSKLLTSNIFHHFYIEDALITTFHTFHIDGRVVQEFYSKEEKEAPDFLIEEFSTWETMRPICFDLIKGKRTPVQFKFVLHSDTKTRLLLSQSNECTIEENQIRALVFTIKYESGVITCTTGTSLNTFLLDKSIDVLWDQWAKRFLHSNEINYEEC